MIKEIRKYYKIDQEMLSAQLRITRSHLSMYELGLRDIPNNIYLSMTHFFEAIIETKATDHAGKVKEGIEKQRNKLEKFIGTRLRANEYKIQKLERSLLRMAADQAQSLRILESIETLKKAPKEEDRVLLGFIEGRARQMQAKTGEDEQFKIEFKIRSLRDEISFLKKQENKI